MVFGIITDYVQFIQLCTVYTMYSLYNYVQEGCGVWGVLCWLTFCRACCLCALAALQIHTHTSCTTPMQGNNVVAVGVSSSDNAGVVEKLENLKKQQGSIRSLVLAKRRLNEGVCDSAVWQVSPMCACGVHVM